MSHSDPMRLHRVSLAIVVVSNVPCEMRGEGDYLMVLTLQGHVKIEGYFVAYFDRIGAFEERIAELPIRVELIRHS